MSNQISGLLLLNLTWKMIAQTFPKKLTWGSQTFIQISLKYKYYFSLSISKLNRIGKQIQNDLLKPFLISFNIKAIKMFKSSLYLYIFHDKFILQNLFELVNSRSYVEN